MFFNFGDMGGMGGMGAPSGPVKNERFYELLGVAKDATESEIKKAYRKKAIQHHPDKGGDPAVFQELAGAYEVLSDPQKRQIYDQYGEEGLEGGAASGGSDAMDIFDMMFGGGGRRGGGQRRVRKTKDTTFTMEASLQQLFTGATRKIAVNRDVLCKTCDGHGGPASKFQECRACDGKGHVVRVQRMGPVIHQTQGVCDKCEGQGKSIDPKFLCTPCRGKGIKPEKKTLEVYIPKGCNDEEKIVFEGMSDEAKDCIPGDVIVVVKESAHAQFKRAGSALVIEREVSLVDMLCGFQLDLVHLDGQKVIITKPPGLSNDTTNSDIIKCSTAQKVYFGSQCLTVPQQGMYIKDSPRRGPLHVVLKVKWPDTSELNELTLGTLRQVLPKSSLPAPKFSMDSGDCDIAVLEKFQQARETTSKGQHDSDDGMHGGHAEGVQCRQQ